MFSKMLIFCFCFIGIFALLLGTMDSRFLAVQSLNAEYQTDKEAAKYFEMQNITAQTYTAFFLLYGDGNSRFEQFNLPAGHAIEFWWYIETRAGPFFGRKALEIRHVWPAFPIGNLSVNLAVIYPYSQNVTFPAWGLWRDPAFGVDDLAELWENRAINTSYCEWQHGGYNVKTFIGPHNSTRDISESWDDGNLTFTVGFTYDWNTTTINGFEMLGQILFFQSPVLGVAGIAGTILNAMVAIPLWIMIAILAVKLIQSIIPFIRGIEE